MVNFDNYSLSEINGNQDGVYALADNLLPEMAEGLGFELSPQPCEQNLRDFIGAIGPAKTLQDNIELVQRRLGVNESAATIATGWVERSGVLNPRVNSFAEPSCPLPSGEDAPKEFIMMGGVARWMLRRARSLEAYLRQHESELLSESGEGRAAIHITAGEREMKISESELVVRYIKRYGGETPTEIDFAHDVIMPLFEGNWLIDEVGSFVRPVNSKDGKEIALAAVEASEVIRDDKPIVVVGNAPMVIQAAAQVRAEVRRAAEGGGVSPDYDRGAELGKRIFVLADGARVARHGESAATHQNPYTALGQIARNALYLQSESSYL